MPKTAIIPDHAFWQRHAKATLVQLRESGKAVVIPIPDGHLTIHDEAELRTIVAAAEREEMIEFLRVAGGSIPVSQWRFGPGMFLSPAVFSLMTLANGTAEGEFVRPWALDAVGE